MTTAIKRRPCRSAYAEHRGGILRKMSEGSHENALRSLLVLRNVLPPSVELLDDLVTCYWQLNDHETALRLSEILLESIETGAQGWAKHGAMLMSLGRLAEAEKAFEAALDRDNSNARVLASLNRLAPFERGSHRAQTLRKIAKSARSDRQARIVALNALGHVENRADRTKAAIYHWRRSKSLTPGTFDGARLDKHVDAQRRLFRYEKSEGSLNKANMVFVVGLPRSGTTLVESILSQHPDVVTLGESPALVDCLAEFQRKMGCRAPWSWQEVLDPRQVQNLRNDYLTRQQVEMSKGQNLVFLDKTPLNLFEIGFASMLFPTAKFVFLSRHPLDVGLSNFSTNFHAPQPFSKSFENIACMTRAAFRSAEQYQSEIGTQFRWQSYAALVQSSEAEIRALLRFLGLAWQDDCLRPEQRLGAVATASLLQVRDGIHDKNQGKWQRFETELAPLIKALGGWDWIDRWMAKDANFASEA